MDEEASGGAGDAAERQATKRVAWSQDEDAVLRERVRPHGGAHNWVSISAALTGRNAKSCRLRWCQHLDPRVNDAKPLTPEEDAEVVELQRWYPNNWSTIAGYLPGRTDNAVKNRWNSVLSKQQQRQTLPLFPLTPGDVRMAGGDDRPVLRHYPPAKTSDTDAGDDQSAACPELFPLAPGDLNLIVGNNNASDAEPMDEECVELSLWPSTRTMAMTAFKAMVHAVRALT